MIRMNEILEWEAHTPWGRPDFVEQDLVLSRAVVNIFSSEALREKIAFRGGTALNKLFFTNPARFSEDIDLVQIRPEPIGNTLDEIRSLLDPWLGEPRRVLKEGRAVLNYRYITQDSKLKVKLKVEINTREHRSRLPRTLKPFEVKSRWFSGAAIVNTFCLEELLGTKIRALYQRKKGRDLFDLWYADQFCKPKWQSVIDCFNFYIGEQNVTISAKEFEANIFKKMSEPLFIDDIKPLKRPSLDYISDQAAYLIDFLSKKITSDKA